MNIPKEDDPKRMKLPPVIWNYIEGIFNENNSRFQKDLSLQILESIHETVGQALEEYKNKKDNKPRR